MDGEGEGEWAPWRSRWRLEITNLPTSEDSALGDAHSSEPQDIPASPNDELLSQCTSVVLYAASCDGPGTASTFGEFLEFY